MKIYSLPTIQLYFTKFVNITQTFFAKTVAYYMQTVTFRKHSSGRAWGYRQLVERSLKDSGATSCS